MPEVSIQNIRLEIQLSEAVIDDAALAYAMAKVGTSDMNLVCAEVLRMVLRKHKGIVRRTIGKYQEVIDPKVLMSQIKFYSSQATSTTAFDDGTEHPDSFFTREGL